MNLKRQILGASTESLHIESSADHAEVAAHMVDQTRRHLDIVSRHLDPQVYDTGEFIDAVTTLVAGNRHARVRIIVLDPEPLIRTGHRLLDLASRLSSFIEIKIPGPDFQDYNQAMLLADESGFIYRKHSDRYDALAHFNDKSYVSELKRQFEDIWETAEIDPNFRRLSL